jgi:hypothetical protein
MPLSWNEIRARAIEFSMERENASSKDAEAKSFRDGYIELLWKGTLQYVLVSDVARLCLYDLNELHDQLQAAEYDWYPLDIAETNPERAGPGKSLGMR